MRKKLPYFAAGILSFFTVFGLSADYSISHESNQKTNCDAELALETNNLRDTHVSASCSLGESDTQGVMQQQIDADTESDDFFIGCGTIM